MIIEYQNTFHSVSPELETILTRGLLGLYLIHQDMIKTLIVFNEDKVHHSTGNKLCEIIVNFPGKDLYVYCMEDNFELSAMDAFNKLQGVLLKRLIRKGATNSANKETGILH